MFRVQRFSRHAISRMACIVASFMLVGFFLVACGSNTTVGGGGTTPTPAKPAPTVNCGQVQSRANTVAPTDKAAALVAANCFYSAYQKCQPATLTFSDYGVDTETVHHLAVKNANSSCTVSDGWQHSIAPKPLSNIVTFTCTGISMQSNGLYLNSCGQAGSFVIPLK